MLGYLEQLASSLWNRLHGWTTHKDTSGSLLGYFVTEGEVTRQPMRWSEVEQTTHAAILGKTGSGKSSLLRLMAQQDIERGRGFLFFDLHGDATQFLLRTVAKQELERAEDLHEQLIVIAPSDQDYSVGFNPLENVQSNFVRIAEFTELLMQRWGLERFGARTDELLRNSLYVLAVNGFTLLELSPLLTQATFRTTCLKNVTNPEIHEYFEHRYNKASEAMQAVMREPILNRTSSFTADPSFRHIIGQERSTFTISEAMDKGQWIIADLPKGRLGEQSLTLGSLLFTIAKQALFARKHRTTFTIYIDEVQNFMSNASGIETMLSEARKFGVSIVTANQFLGQHSEAMRAAILSVGTHIFFQLSPSDASAIAQAFDGGKSLSERLKNLPQRHFVMKSGANRWREARVPAVETSRVSPTDLLKRSREHFARPVASIEAQIIRRHAAFAHKNIATLDDWE